MLSTQWNVEIGILVMGAGGCGLAAAPSANELAEVKVAEEYEASPTLLSC